MFSAVDIRSMDGDWEVSIRVTEVNVSPVGPVGWAGAANHYGMNSFSMAAFFRDDTEVSRLLKHIAVTDTIQQFDIYVHEQGGITSLFRNCYLTAFC